mmetsp:Transcript_61624/g.149190  ORF Transcript_61624/g.149190 Transcript_61624/m.149190 type:complete len:107 (+) Transcript_61624:2-322(+)
MMEANGGWMSPQASNVAGPDAAEECEHLAWVIDGRDELVAMVDPEVEAKAKAVEDGAGSDSTAPSTVQNPFRQPAPTGTKFRVRLRINGKFRYIEWEKLEEAARPS